MVAVRALVTPPAKGGMDPAISHFPACLVKLDVPRSSFNVTSCLTDSFINDVLRLHLSPGAPVSFSSLPAVLEERSRSIGVPRGADITLLLPLSATSQCSLAHGSLTRR